MGFNKCIGELGLCRSRAVGSLDIRGGISHGGRTALSGWQSRRCLAACPVMPCGVQMAGWNERRGGTLLSG